MMRAGALRGMLVRPVLRVELWRFTVLLGLFLLVSAGGLVLGVDNLPLLHVELLLLAGWLTTTAAGLAIGLALTVAVVRVVQHVLGFEQLFVSAYFFWLNLRSFPWPVQVATLLGTTAAMAGLVSLFRLLPRKVVGVTAPMLVLAVVAVALLSRLEERTRVNMVGTSFGYLFGSVRFASMFTGGFELPAAQRAYSAAADGAQRAEGTKSHLLVVLVESMGVPQDPSLVAGLMAPLLSPAVAARYRVTTGTTPAQGSTIHGELRELCGGHLAVGLFRDGNEHCLAHVMRVRGYRTLAFHANDAQVYGRDVWYPKVGFQSYFNAGSEQVPRLPAQGRWGSLLDADAIGWIRDYLGRQNTPHFAYLLTVSTHLPAMRLPDATDLPDCAARASADVCVHLANLRGTLTAVAKAALTLDNTVIVLAGDHPPPYVQLGNRRQFQRAHVPYAILEPRIATMTRPAEK